MEPVDYPYCKLNTAAFKSESSCLLYDPPIPEFAVLRTELKGYGAKVTYVLLPSAFGGGAFKILHAKWSIC